jgi:arginine/lysine/ornithine decarboxylase
MLENALYISTTTSPSSLILLSIEETVVSNFKDEEAMERIRKTVSMAKYIRDELKRMSHDLNISIFEADESNF